MASSGSGGSERKLTRRFMKCIRPMTHKDICYYLGDPSVDSHARFNLSPVPSVEDDEDSILDHQQPTNLPNIEQDDVGEENEQFITGPRASTITTTVQMLDSNTAGNNPIGGDQNDVEGLNVKDFS